MALRKISTHAGRHAEKNTGRVHRRTAGALREQVHEAKTMSGGPIKHTSGNPDKSYGGREDTGEGLMSALTNYTSADRMAKANLTRQPLSSEPDMPAFSMGGENE